jgi:spermidine synthase
MRKTVLLLLASIGLLRPWSNWAGVVFEETSPYHHIKVVDHFDMRTLSFDGSMESRISLADPFLGHFEYTKLFHMIWLWNPSITNILMMGLGAGTTQRTFQRYYPEVVTETVELDPMVLEVAKGFFQFQESTNLLVQIEDGRVFLKRSQKQYDAIIMDAYTANRYGSFIPYQLATKEFFKLANDHLSTNGVLAYNVIGSLQGFRADILGSIYKTMKTVFPQVYLFPAKDTLNVVLIASKHAQPCTSAMLQQRAALFAAGRKPLLPNFMDRLKSFRTEPPPSFSQSPLLTDDYAPVDGLLSTAAGK